MTERQGFGGTQMLLAFLGGAAAGAAVALLTAASSGEQTREQIGAYLNSGKEKTKHIPEAFRSATVAAREAFVEAMNNGSAT